MHMPAVLFLSAAQLPDQGIACFRMRMCAGAFRNPADNGIRIAGIRMHMDAFAFLQITAQHIRIARCVMIMGTFPFRYAADKHIAKAVFIMDMRTGSFFGATGQDIFKAAIRVHMPDVFLLAAGKLMHYGIAFCRMHMAVPFFLAADQFNRILIACFRMRMRAGTRFDAADCHMRIACRCMHMAGIFFQPAYRFIGITDFGMDMSGILRQCTRELRCIAGIRMLMPHAFHLAAAEDTGIALRGMHMSRAFFQTAVWYRAVHFTVAGLRMHMRTFTLVQAAAENRIRDIACLCVLMNRDFLQSADPIPVFIIAIGGMHMVVGILPVTADQVPVPVIARVCMLMHGKGSCV